MKNYIKPKLITYDTNSLIEITGPAFTQGYLTVGAAKRAELEQDVKQVQICKANPEKQQEIVKLG